MNTSKNNKNTFLFIAGALTGAAAAYYLNTPKGKVLTKKVIDSTREYTDSLKDKASHVTEEIKSKSIDTIQKASETLTSVKSSLKNEVVDKLEAAEETIDDLQAGINKAKKKLKNGTVLS